MDGVSLVLKQLADLRVIVAFIRAQVLRRFTRRFSFGTTMLSSVGSVSFISCLFAPPTARLTGMPFPSTSRLRFVPDFPYRWDSGLCFFPPSGAFVIAPSIACHSQFKPFFVSYSINPASHRRWKTPASRHSWNRSWMVLDAPRLLGSAFHWHPVRRT